MNNTGTKKGSVMK